MNASTPHWTDDAGLLADFVLDRVDPQARPALEAHLRDCAACREAVDAERMIAAGAKTLGREELKRRLRAGVSVARSREIPWPHILSAAAVLVIITGIGVMNRWFVSTEDVLLEESPMVSTVPKPTESEPLKDSPPEPESDADASAPARMAVPQSKAFTPPIRKKELTLREAPPGMPSAESRQPEQSGKRKTDDRSRDAIQEQNLTEEEMAASESPFLPSAGAPMGEVAWINGTVIEQFGTSGNETGRETSLKSAAKSPAVGMDQAGQQHSFRIVQRPLSALPLQQQQARQAMTVQALVERVGSQTQLTIFLDTLYHEGRLSRATIRQISDDSILVTVGGQVIGYRIPPPFQASPAR